MSQNKRATAWSRKLKSSIQDDIFPLTDEAGREYNPQGFYEHISYCPTKGRSRLGRRCSLIASNLDSFKSLRNAISPDSDGMRQLA